MAHLVRQEFHRIHRAHLHQDTAQYPHFGQGNLIDQQLFFSCAGFGDIDRREDTLIGKFAVQYHLAIACPFKFFKDHFIHARACFDQGSCDNGKRAALLYITGSPEKAFWPLQGIRIHPACQYLARRWHNGVIGPCQTGYRIQQNHHIALVFYQPFRFLDHHIGNLNMA